MWQLPTRHKNIHKKPHADEPSVLLNIEVPYQSPSGQENLCWVSIAVAAHNFFHRAATTFDRVCKEYPKLCKNDQPGDLDAALLNIGIVPKKIGTDLADEHVVAAVKKSISNHQPVVLRLETASASNTSSHFIFITGYTNSVPTKWFVKDPSGANVCGKDSPNTLTGPLTFTRRYEHKYTIKTVVVLSLLR